MATPMIKKSRRGLLHKKLGVKPDEKIGVAKLEKAAHSKSPDERREADFALNMNGHAKAPEKAHKAAKKHFGAGDIADAIGETATIQQRARRGGY